MKKISDRVTSNKSKHLLVETRIKKTRKFHAAYFRGKNYFDGDGIQNYLIFQPVCKYFERAGSKISSWESKGLSHENLVLLLQDQILKFNGDFLKQDKVT